MRKSAANDDVLSTRDAAERLGVALRTVQLWVEHGVLPAWKTAGGHRRISRAAVEKLLDERRDALLGASAPAAQAAPAPAAGRLQLLVVEDDPDESRRLCVALEGMELPLDITTAANGFEALLRIGQSCPDVLLTDLELRGMDGFRMIASLQRGGQAYEKMKIVVVTAMAAGEIERRGPLPARVQVFAKPPPPGDLRRVLRDRLAQRAQSARD